MKKHFISVGSRIQRRRTTTTWFITFSVMFMAQLLGWILVADIAIHYVRKQTNEVYQKALNVLIQSYDNSMEMVHSMLNVMAVDEDILKSIGETENAWQKEVTRRALMSYRVQHSFVDDVFIYFRDSGQVISSNTVATSWIFYNAYADVAMPYEQWQSAMEQTYFKQDVSWESSEGKENLWIFHTLPVFSEEGAGGRITVGVKFNATYVQSLVDSFSMDNSIAVVIMDNAGRTIIESQNTAAIQPERSIVGSSDLSGWIYTAYMPGEAVQNYEKNLPLILLACLGIEILIFIFAFYFFVKTNYNPFTELIEYINRQNPDGMVSGSEYVYIKDSFDEIVKKRKEDEEEFLDKLNRLKVAHLIQIIRGNIPIEKADRYVMEEMHLSFIFEPCAVLLISGERREMPGQKDCSAVMKPYGVGMGGNSVFYGCSFEYEDMVVCIFRLDNDPEELKTKLSELWKKMGEEITGEYVMAASSLKRTDNQLGKAYEEAQFVMQGASRLSVAGLLFYDELRENVRESVRDNKEEYMVHMAKEYIAGHYMESDLTVDQLCRDMGRSVSHISRLFKEKTGQSILYYINMVRIEEAKRLLTETERSISIDEIGRRVGFTSSNSFIRIFKKYEQVTPGKYREMNMLVPHEIRQ